MGRVRELTRWQLGRNTLPMRAGLNISFFLFHCFLHCTSCGIIKSRCVQQLFLLYIVRRYAPTHTCARGRVTPPAGRVVIVCCHLIFAIFIFCLFLCTCGKRIEGKMIYVWWSGIRDLKGCRMRSWLIDPFDWALYTLLCWSVLLGTFLFDLCSCWWLGTVILYSCIFSMREVWRLTNDPKSSHCLRLLSKEPLRIRS